jgi:hypothetical protein
MTEMTERVARAIHSRSRDHANDWDELSPYYHNKYRQDALAAIEAMREPTLEMRHAGRRVKSSWLVENEEVEIWQNMIDESLK